MDKVSFTLRAVSVACSFYVALQSCGCAQEHGRIEGPPLYVHLCDAMPQADREAWGEAAGALNAGLVDPVLWVGNGEPDGCNTVDVCRGLHNTISNDGCVISLRYEAGAAHAVAEGGLVAALEVAR